MGVSGLRRSRCWLGAAGALLAFVASAAPVVAQPEVRVIGRDTRGGGSPSLAMEALEPYFDSGPVHEALRNLERGRASRAIGDLQAWLGSSPQGPERDGVRFALGHALVLAERWQEAIDTLDGCVSERSLFEDYCLYAAAQAQHALGRYSEAEASAGAVHQSAVHGPRARHLQAQALLDGGRADQAVSALLQFLVTWPEASYRRDVEFDLARAYEVAGEPDEAARVYQRIALVNPGDAAERRAQAAIAALRPQLTEEVRREVENASAAQSLQRAQVLFDRHRSEQVISLMEPIVARGARGGETTCQGAYLIARSLTKLRRHTDSVPWYTQVVDHCADEDLRIKALYNLGRGLWNANRNQEAFDTYRRLWTDYPAHSYADDAMTFGARVLRNMGRDADAAELLRLQISNYPQGDMLADAVWLLMAERYAASDFRGAIRLAEELGARSGESDLYTRGRLGYFRGRSLEQLSLVGEARAQYVEVLRAHPMSWYALMALNRLHTLAPVEAATLMATLRTPTPETEAQITLRPPALRQDPTFRLGVEFLRLGLFGMAEAEFRKLSRQWANEEDIGWIVSWLYDRAGAYHLSHHTPGGRTALTLWYPSEGNQDRWEISYPRPHWELVSRFAAERELDPFMVYAIMREESGFRADIESWANARGLLQLMHGTANDMAALTGRGSVTTQQLFDPDINVELGTMYMRRLGALFGNHPAMIIAGYNGGQGNVRNWLRARGAMPLDLWVEEIPYAQTRDYVKRVTMSYWVYSWLYGGADAWVQLPFDLSRL